MQSKVVAMLILPILISSFILADAAKESYKKDIISKKMSSHDISKKSIKHNTTALDPMEHGTIHNANKRPMAKIKKKENLRRLAQISEQEAVNIVRNATKERLLSIQLIHKADYIAYELTTEHKVFTVNAIDGTLMK